VLIDPNGTTVGDDLMSFMLNIINKFTQAG